MVRKVGLNKLELKIKLGSDEIGFKYGMLSDFYGLRNNKPEGLLGVIEVYIKADPKDAIYEYWLPVVKKEDNSGSINN